LFAKVAEVQTQGATDVEHFVLEGGKKHYLAFSNEGDIGKRTHQVSHIYELAVETHGGVEGGEEL
jgi:hypothetical protein